VKLLKSNLNELHNYKQSNIITSSLNAQSIYSVDIPQDAIIVIGNEGSGISKEIDDLATISVSIPAHESSKTDSLNASVSAGILASLCRRPS